MEHPTDRHLVVYGRQPVLEVLGTPDLAVAKVFVSERAHGEAIDAIASAAAGRGVPLERVRDEMVTAVSRNGRHHQGVAADVVAPGLQSLDSFLERRAHGRAYRTSVLVLDSIHNPANVGMIIRSAAAAGLDGIVVPRRGTAELGPLVHKASAGVAFRAPLIRCDTSADAVERLGAARFTVVGLDARPEAASLFDATLPERAAYVLGNESTGVSPSLADHVDEWFRIPLADGVESLNVATAATLLAFEVARRRS